VKQDVLVTKELKDKDATRIMVDYSPEYRPLTE
jgi:hypothetical protein